MIKRIVERYCLKQLGLITRLQEESNEKMSTDPTYVESYGYHKQKRSLVIAAIKYNTAIDLFLKDSEFKKIEIEL